MAEWEGEALGRLRQGLYRLFAASFLYPEEGRLAILVDTVKRLDQDYLAQFAFHNSWMRLRCALQREATVTGLETEYVRLFSAGPSGPLCPPHESSYVTLPGQPASLSLIELEREYARFGLTLPSDYENLPDHVSVEMEAMASLCGKEAMAWKDGNARSARRLLEDERRFIERHLGSWFPMFAGNVRRETRDIFYATIAEAADAFVRHDVDLVQVLTREVAV
ncbi:MAG: molecular chaperone TorD family protein [Thermoplasmata archaeon]